MFEFSETLTHTPLFEKRSVVTQRAPRADAARNRDAILDAALELFAHDARASLADVARRAGVGRVTLYGHFASREELLDALTGRTLERAEAELAQVDLSGDALDALERLVHGSWQIVERFHTLLGVEPGMHAEQLRGHHAEPLARVESLIRRGQAEGSIRSDLPATWLTSCFHVVLHAAASEVRAGRLGDDQATAVVASTVLSLVCRQPGPGA